VYSKAGAEQVDGADLAVRAQVDFLALVDGADLAVPAAQVDFLALVGGADLAVLAQVDFLV
jgi:hypothetical protein